MKFICSERHLSYSLSQGIRFILVHTEQWVEYPFQKTSPGVWGIHNSNRGNGTREGRVGFNLVLQSARIHISLEEFRPPPDQFCQPPLGIFEPFKSFLLCRLGFLFMNLVIKPF